MVRDLYTITQESLLNLWGGLLNFVPQIIIVLLVVFVGWGISVGFGGVVAEILRRLKFNQLFERGIWKEALERADFKIDSSGFIGAIVKWILMIMFLLIAVEVLGLPAFADFLARVLEYLPNVLVASLILIVTVVISEFSEKIVRVGVESTKVGYGRLVGSIVKWSIWVFAIMAILRQLLIVPDLITILFKALVYGVVALFVIAGGIAFGLGGKNVAEEILRDLKNKIKK